MQAEPEVPPGPPADLMGAFTDFCHALLNSNEFLSIIWSQSSYNWCIKIRYWLCCKIPRGAFLDACKFISSKEALSCIQEALNFVC